MHFSASIAQLIATFIMTVLRVAIRRKITRGPEGQYDTDINQVNTKPQPRTSHVSELPEGRELHHIAKYITKCKVWKVVGLVGGSQDPQCPAHHFLEARITLAEISGPSWQNEVHQIGSFVAQGIEVMMNNIWGKRGRLSVSEDAAAQTSFFWAVRVFTEVDGVCEEVSIPMSAKRKWDNQQHWEKWQVDKGRICGILYLWISQLQEDNVPDWGKNLWLLGPNDSNTRLLSEWWIGRDTQTIEFRSRSTASEEHGIDQRRIFDFEPDEVPNEGAVQWNGRLNRSFPDLGGWVGVITTNSLRYTCSEYLLFAFICNVVKLLDDFETATTAKTSHDRHPLILTNDDIQYLAELVQGAGVTTTDSYRITMSALARAGRLLNPLKDREFSGILEVAKIVEQREQQQICDTLRWHCKQDVRAGVDYGRLAEAGSLNINVTRKVIDTFGPGHPETLKTMDSMKEVASLLFRIQPALHVKVTQSDPHPLHSAARMGLVEEAYYLIEDSLLTGGSLEIYDVMHTPLSLAVIHCQVKVVILLLLFGASVHVSGFPENKSMLHLAVESSQSDTQEMKETSNTEIVKLLLIGGASIDAVDIYAKSALYKAIQSGNVSKARVLLEWTDKSTALMPLEESLIFAASRGYSAIVQILLDKGANKDARDQPGRTALHYAAEQGHDKTVQVLLTEGVNPNIGDMNNNSALHLAAEGGYATIVEQILQAGAGKDATNISGQTPLHIAVHNGYDPIVRMLLDAGVDVEANDNARLTALHLAVRDAHETTVRMLLEARANIDAKNQNGWVVLHRAARYGNERIVRVLLETGANKNEVCQLGWTALHFAVVGQSRAVLELLLEAGLDRNVESFSGNTPLALARAQGNAVWAAELLAEK